MSEVEEPKAAEMRISILVVDDKGLVFRTTITLMWSNLLAIRKRDIKIARNMAKGISPELKALIDTWVEEQEVIMHGEGYQRDAKGNMQ